MKQESLFERSRSQMTDSVEAAMASLRAYGERMDWAVAWSGGKDSTAALTFVVWAVLTGQVPRPRSLTVLYADTRLELPPLALAAATLMDELRDKAEALAAVGVRLDVRVVVAPIDDRFFVNILGRGVPPPHNMFRWCTPAMKVEPMLRELRALRERAGAKFLTLTGVRLGESAARDARIALSCTKEGAECGQGWFQQATPEAIADTLAPLLEWRICHVWEWLAHWAPTPPYGDWSTELLAEVYGGRDGSEAAEVAARTGCIKCPLVTEDRALEGILRKRAWSHLAPLRRLGGLYDELRRPARRLRKPGGERTKTGNLAAKQQRLGPLTLDTRRWALGEVLSIQAEVNEQADERRRPRIDLLNTEEVARIEWHIEHATWPDGWTGSEPTGDVELDVVHNDGTVQLRLRPKADQQ